MRKNVSKKSYPELDKFDRKQKKHTGLKNQSSKSKLSIYDEFEDEGLINYSSELDEFKE